MIRIRYVKDQRNKQYYEKNWLWCRDKGLIDLEVINWSFWITNRIVVFTTEPYIH